MPFLNSLGEWAAGVGGSQASWGSASGVGIIVWSPGGGTDWMDDNTIIAQHSPGGSNLVKTKNIRSGAELTVDARGANVLSGGGGQWAAWLAGTGVYSSTGLHLPNAWISPTSVGPDGAIAVKRDYASFSPWDVYEVDGLQWVLEGSDIKDVQLFGSRRAIWVDGGEPKAIGVPVPQPVTRPFWWLRMLETPDGWWTLYQESGTRLLLQDKDGKGYVVTVGDSAFRPDLMYLSANPKTIRVVWSLHEGESPADIQVRDIQIDVVPRVDIGGLPLPDIIGGTPPVGLPPGTIVVTNYGSFNRVGLSDEALIFPPDPAPAYPFESGYGRLVHPTAGAYDYEVKPDEWVNIDADVIIPPVWSSQLTLTSAASVLWPGHLRDVVVEERWKALGGLAMPMTQLRRLTEMWMRSIDPEVAYVKWYPTYITRLGYKVLILSVTSGGQQGIKFDDVGNYLDEDGNEIGWMTAPVTVQLRLVERL